MIDKDKERERETEREEGEIRAETPETHDGQRT